LPGRELGMFLGRLLKKPGLWGEAGEAMNLFLYMRTPGGREDGLLSAVAPYVSAGSLEVFTDFRSFAERARKPKQTPSVAVVYNPNAPDLRALVSLRDFLRDVRVLLILPDQDEETIALAHRVRPAYLAYVDDGISGVVSVLKRLTGGGARAVTRGPRR